MCLLVHRVLLLVGSGCGGAKNTEWRHRSNEYLVRTSTQNKSWHCALSDALYGNGNRLHYGVGIMRRRRPPLQRHSHPPYFHEALVSAAAAVHASTRLVPGTSSKDLKVSSVEN